ncbi:hypothetical protein GC722_08855 [Auraticoccus sp. F435]|uniref:Uncharacterized protein n=1 Tax=Auraticoccus cholistanensis TaxID=2656650 RepID=A0A6A9V0X8_9ACTN|nr:hypothetical protein [Auraticoccus cholistanensis]MVA76130.1 hypothetical protein [Auraticoccus cholistanensis]
MDITTMTKAVSPSTPSSLCHLMDRSARWQTRGVDLVATSVAPTAVPAGDEYAQSRRAVKHPVQGAFGAGAMGGSTLVAGFDATTAADPQPRRLM